MPHPPRGIRRRRSRPVRSTADAPIHPAGSVAAGAACTLHPAMTCSPRSSALLPATAPAMKGFAMSLTSARGPLPTGTWDAGGMQKFTTAAPRRSTPVTSSLKSRQRAPSSTVCACSFWACADRSLGRKPICMYSQHEPGALASPSPLASHRDQPSTGQLGASRPLRCRRCRAPVSHLKSFCYRSPMAQMGRASATRVPDPRAVPFSSSCNRRPCAARGGGAGGSLLAIQCHT